MIKALCAPLVYTGGRCVSGMAVLVEGEMITGVTRDTDLPPGADIERHEGCTLIPGLFDCHVHIEDWMLPLLLSYGVTTARDMSNEPRYIFSRREMMKKPTAAGPNILCCGPGLDGYPYVHEYITWAMRCHTDIDDAVALLERNNVDFIKLYVNLDDEMAAHIVRECVKRGIHTAAHFQGGLKAADAIRLGVNEIEHLHEAPAGFDGSFIEAIVKSGTWVCPTQTVWESFFICGEHGDRYKQGFCHVPPGNIRTHLLRYAEAGKDEEQRMIRQRFKERQREYLTALIGAGGKIIAGTDTPCQMALPGVSLIDELVIYTQCGMSCAQAIASATCVPARLHNVNAGAIERGKRADIAAVCGNPLDDIQALYNVKTVYKSGRRYESGALRQTDTASVISGCLPEVDKPAEICEDWRALYEFA